MLHNEGVIDKWDLFVFVFCVFLTVASLLMLLAGFQPDYWSSILALTAASLGGILITIKSTRALLKHDFGVDALASVAVWISVLIGEYLAAAFVVIMLNGGGLVEDYVSRRTSRAIETLIKSAPVTARIRRSGGAVEVGVEEVKVGDILLVKPGEKIPLDGEVLKGIGFVDQASITGESIPSEKSSGDQVYGNTLLENGALDIRVTRAHNDTAFAHIVKQVEEALSRKSHVERVADRYAGWFAPIILVLAIATQLVTKNPLSTAAVLVISCPCALTLATPIAVAAGLGNAARNGVLIRGGSSLEEVGRCDVAIIDKTGTVTLGKPRVVKIKPLRGLSVDEVLSLAGAAEQRSEHSLAKAILGKVSERGITPADPDEFHVRSGSGVVARFNGHTILVGNLKLMEDHGVNLDEESKSYIDVESRSGRTAVLVAEDSEAAGIISIADTLREGVRDSVSQIRRAGAKKVVMFTGDRLPAAMNVAEQAGIDEVYAELLPEDKARHIKQYERQGYRTLVIGDGINDAPALAMSNVGIAMGVTGTDVAIETAGIVLMTDDLSKVAKTMMLSQKVLAVIRQNIIFALAVNLIGLLLSTQGFLSPVLASVVHEGSALIVVLNSAGLLQSKILAKEPCRTTLPPPPHR